MKIYLQRASEIAECVNILEKNKLKKIDIMPPNLYKTAKTVKGREGRSDEGRWTRGFNLYFNDVYNP
jgi:hypothetical protein